MRRRLKKPLTAMITILLLEKSGGASAGENQLTPDPEYNILSASTGDSAAELAHRHCELIDVVLIDVDLGNGLTGIDIAHGLLADSEIPVLFQLNTVDTKIIERVTSIRSLGCIDKHSSEFVKKATILSALRFHHIKPKSGKWAHLFSHTDWELTIGDGGADTHSIDEVKRVNSILHATLDSIDEGILVVDRNGTISDLNKRFITMWNIPEPLIADRDDKDLLTFILDQVAQPKAFLKRVEHYYASAELSGTDVIELKNGRIFERYTQAQHLDNTIVGRVWIFRDITERKKAEDALRRSERLLRESQEIAKIGYFITDVATGRWESSPILNKIFGMDDAALHDGDEWNDLIAPSYRQEAREHYFSTIRDRRQYGIEYRIIRPSDGETRWISALGDLEYDATGDPVRMIGTVQDITERRLLEQQLHQSQKLEGLGTLAGGIAHDFNNLLALILGSAELLERQCADNPRMKKNVDRIIEASERGTSISRQLLLFSRPEQATLKPISLSHTIGELHEMLSHFLPRSIEITTSIEVDNGIIQGDAGQIHQALLNLALNAGDAMTNNGTLTIREYITDAETMKRMYGTAQPVPYIAVSVSDTGTGMDPALLEKIFDPFFTTKPQGKGTGLGLGIVHGIIKNHNGYIGVTSTPGEGTTFTLYFPLIHPFSPVEERCIAGPTPRESGTILIVDDEALLREMLVEFLGNTGYSVLTASNGMEALDLYAERGAEIDLVITDLGMPGMGGEELYRRLRSISPEVKVMIASGYLEGTTRDHFMALGVKDVLTKPFKLNDIRGVIHAVMHPEEVSADC